MKFWKLYNSGIGIIIFATIGVVLGFFLGDKVAFLKPIGDVFIALIKMVIIPIVFFAILNATVTLGTNHNVAKLGFFSIGYFFISSFVAGLLGVGAALIFTPGHGVKELPLQFLTLSDSLKEATSNVKFVNFWDFLFNLIPSNPIKSMAEGHLLSILFFAIVLGIAIAYVKNDKKENFIGIVSVTNDALMLIVRKVMLLAPIAVFSLMAYLVGTLGVEVVYLVGKLFLVIILSLIIWLYVVLAGCVALFTKISYFDFVKTMLPLNFLSFSTSSSLVSLPKNFETCAKLGVHKEVSTFMLPIGATLNMDGSSLYYSIVAIFFIQMFGINVAPYTYIMIALTAALGSMGTPGVPGLSLTIIMVLMVAHIPLIGLPLIFAIDRILDMFVTTVNVAGDTTGAVLANRVIYNKS